MRDHDEVHDAPPVGEGWAVRAGKAGGEVTVTMVVDVANVMGSRPDGWWRDRAGAATCWLADLNRLPGVIVRLPDGGSAPIRRVVAVLEGRARAARVPQPCAVEVVLAEKDGDTAVVELVTGTVTDPGGAEAVPCRREGSGGDDPVEFHVREVKDGVLLVVTADRGLRSRLPAGVEVAGPGWLRALLD